MEHHSKFKGDIAVARTIADLTEKEYDILVPAISEHLPFDLVAYKNKQLYRIQCKYSKNNYASGKTSWSDKNGAHTKDYDDNDFDYYAIYLPDISKVVYPSIKFKGCYFRTTMPNSGTPFYWYEDFLEFTDKAEKKTYKDFLHIISHFRTNRKTPLPKRKVKWPTKEELDILLWEKPTVQIAKDFGVSDKAIYKWAKQYGLEKPPRGYWAKKKAGKI